MKKTTTQQHIELYTTNNWNISQEIKVSLIPQKINVIYHTNSIKGQNHMIISIDKVKNIFKNPLSFMIK